MQAHLLRRSPSRYRVRRRTMRARRVSWRLDLNGSLMKNHNSPAHPGAPRDAGASPPAVAIALPRAAQDDARQEGQLAFGVRAGWSRDIEDQVAATDSDVRELRTSGDGARTEHAVRDAGQACWLDARRVSGLGQDGLPRLRGGWRRRETSRIRCLRRLRWPWCRCSMRLDCPGPGLRS